MNCPEKYVLSSRFDKYIFIMAWKDRVQISDLSAMFECSGTARPACGTPHPVVPPLAPSPHKWHPSLHVHTLANSYRWPLLRPRETSASKAVSCGTVAWGRGPLRAQQRAQEHWGSVLVCLGCSNRLPWTGWLG